MEFRSDDESLGILWAGGEGGLEIGGEETGMGGATRLWWVFSLCFVTVSLKY